MYNITLSEEIKRHCPEYRGAAVFAEVTNSTYNEGLWQEIAAFTQGLRSHGQEQKPARHCCHP